jgi:hypothetical protein
MMLVPSQSCDHQFIIRAGSIIFQGRPPASLSLMPMICAELVSRTAYRNVQRQSTHGWERIPRNTSTSVARSVQAARGKLGQHQQHSLERWLT